jgi:hypothetical protein
MGIGTSLQAIGDVIDPFQSYWSVLLTTGKRWSEHDLVPTFRKGVRGVRKLDWGDDIVSSGDIKRVKEITLHCPDKRTAVLEIEEPGTAFQFKTRSLTVLTEGGGGLEFQVIGRVIDKMSGRCECFIWDYHPNPGQPHLVAYKSTIYNFGAWKDTMMPIGALSLEVQGLRL